MKEDQFEGEHEDKFDKLYDEESSSANWSSCTQLVGWFLILIQPWWAFPTIDLPKRSLWWFCFWMLRVDDIKWKFNRQIESLQSYDIKWKFNKQIKLVRSYDGSVMNVCCSSSSMFFQGIDHKPSKERVYVTAPWSVGLHAISKTQIVPNERYLTFKLRSCTIDKWSREPLPNLRSCFPSLLWCCCSDCLGDKRRWPILHERGPHVLNHSERGFLLSFKSKMSQKILSIPYLLGLWSFFVNSLGLTYLIC